MRRDPQLAKIEASRKKTTRDIRKANKTTQKRGAKEAPSDPLADSVDAAFDAQRALRENEIRSQMENDAKRGAPKQTVSVPGKNEKVRRADMQTVKRVNYVSDVNTLSGDHAKTRKHLESIRAVKGTDMKDGKRNPHAMLLSGDTADRFEMLRDKFDKDPAHAGMRMPVTSVGFGTRGLHEEKWGLGYLGHMLGTTLDLFAYENPNLKANDVEGMRINKYMLERFGRDENGNKGRATLDYLGDDRIEAMGKRTAAGIASADDDDLEKKIRGQYREMSATSERFKGENSLGKDKMKNLREARALYFALEKKREEAASIARALEKAPNDASLKTKLESLQATNDAQDSVIKAYMDAAFKPWKDELQADIEKTQNDGSKDEAYRKNEIDVLQRTRQHFEDPARVFGREGKNGNAKLESSGVPIMQYLEKGFIRDDGTDYTALRKQGKSGEVFNEDVFATLMRHGFASGSYFGDTMHFDFVESQSNLVPGGRNRINMKADRASPENELPDVVNVPSIPTRTTAPPKGSVFDKPSPIPALQTPRPLIEVLHPLAPPPTLLDEE